jgi:NAD(P)-dependent dehydrogenase (short-subunit alcohol dehydrogenase family)
MAPHTTASDNVVQVPLALITGASTGIGRATALRLAAGGWTVFAGVREAAAGERLLADADAAGGASAGSGTGGRLIPLQLEVTDAAQIATARARVEEEAAVASSSGGGGSRSGLDALVNNAGIGIGGPLELISADDLREQFEVNVFAQVAVTQALLPALRRARGRIVFVSSIGGRVAMPFTAPYAASKHAIEAFGDTLRVELRSSGVTVALVEPGSVATPIWDKSRAEAERVVIPAELQEAYGRVPAAMGKALEDTARRGVPPEQVAATIERALSAPRMKARYVIGRDARAMLIARRVLPDLVFDRVARRVLGV